MMRLVNVPAAIVMAVLCVGTCIGCSAQPELISPAKQACYDERNRIRAEIWDQQRRHAGRIIIQRPMPQCWRVK